MRRIRVLLIFSSSELGGAERSLTRMALAASGEVEFTLATLDGGGPWSDWCHELGAQPVVLGERREGAGHGRFGFKSLQNLVSLVRRERYEALYVIGLRASLWLRFMRPLLRGAHLVHGIRWNPVSDSRLDRALRLTEMMFSRLVDLYICNSRIAAATLSKRAGVPQEKTTVIYNGLEQLPNTVDRSTVRAPNVIVVANLNPRKGHQEFLDVVVAVCNRLPQAHFFFVGRDDMNGRVAAEIRRRGLDNKVTLTGYQPDVGLWLKRSALMVVPSLWGEGCPTSILEGFAHGIPVVAYAIDGIPELISDGEDGVLIPPRNGLALTEAVLQVLEDSAMARRMGDNGREKVHARFTLSYCVESHMAAFVNLVADK